MLLVVFIYFFYYYLFRVIIRPGIKGKNYDFALNCQFSYLKKMLQNYNCFIYLFFIFTFIPCVLTIKKNKLKHR